MAIKGDNWIVQDDISFFGNSVMERGGILCGVTAGSGAAMDSSLATVGYVAGPSGSYPVGILLNDMVNYDLTKQHINYHKDETQLGGKVRIGRKGWVVTNKYIGAPVAFAPAYVGVSGLFTPTLVNTVATPKCGQFLSTPDEDGYVKVEVNLPI